MSKFMKRPVSAAILVIALLLAPLGAGAVDFSGNRMGKGAGGWNEIYNNFVTAAQNAINTLTSQVSALFTVVVNWAVTENIPVVFTGALHVDGDTLTVPGDQTAKITAGKLLWADCGPVDGVRASTVASSSYGAGVTTVNLNDSILTANLRAVQVVMTRAGLFPSSIGYVIGGDFGSPGLRTFKAAKAVIASNNRTLSLAPGAWTVDAGCTTGKNINLKPEKGAILDITIPDVPIAGLSRATACVVTWNSHGLETGDMVYFKGITQVGGWTALNGTFQKITKINDNSFSVPVNTSGYTEDYAPGTDPGTYNQTLYIQSFEAGRWQCFNNAAPGKMVFGPKAVDAAFPEWFGAEISSLENYPDCFNAIRLLPLLQRIWYNIPK